MPSEEAHIFHQGPEESGKALVSFAIVLPMIALLLFTGWELGLRTATIPAVSLNISALLGAPMNNSFVADDLGFVTSVEGVQANLHRLAIQTADIAQASGYPNAVGVAAYMFRCDSNFPTPSNPTLLGSFKQEKNYSLDLGEIEGDVLEACVARVSALPRQQCSATHPNARNQQFLCYGDMVRIKLSPVSPAAEIGQVMIIPPGGPCLAPDPGPFVIDPLPSTPTPTLPPTGMPSTPTPEPTPTPEEPTPTLPPETPTPTPEEPTPTPEEPTPTPEEPTPTPEEPTPTPEEPTPTPEEPTPTPEEPTPTPEEPTPTPEEPTPTPEEPTPTPEETPTPDPTTPPPTPTGSPT